MVSDDVVIESVRAMQLVTYFDVAASTFFIWDFILTVPLELDLVWRSKWNALKFIYIIQRYLPFFDTVGLVLYHQLSVALTDLECRNLYIASGCLIVVGITFSEMILTLRAWAVWNRGTRLGIILGVLFAVFFLPDFAFLALFLRSLEFDNPSIPQFVGCLVVRVDHILTGCWMIVLVWDALVLALMVVPGFRAYTVGGNSTLLAVIFRDGALYYFVLFLFSTVNIIIIKLFPPQYAQLLTTMERCMHSTLTSRVLLHIRVQTSKTPPVYREDATVDELDNLDNLDNLSDPGTELTNIHPTALATRSQT